VLQERIELSVVFCPRPLVEFGLGFEPVIEQSLKRMFVPCGLRVPAVGDVTKPLGRRLTRVLDRDLGEAPDGVSRRSAIRPFVELK
jgi:hypothetical protein